jgi:type IV secretory pathway VirB2 component (pilin)
MNKTNKPDQQKTNKLANQKNNTTTIKILIFIVLIITTIVLFTPDVMDAIASSFDIDAKFDEGESKLRGWFNKASVIALIVTGALWLKGKINWMIPSSIFGALILVNSATEIVAWFA